MYTFSTELHETTISAFSYDDCMQEQFHTVFQRVANTAASPAGEDSISLVFYETGETNVVQPEIGQIGEQKAPESYCHIKCINVSWSQFYSTIRK